MSAAEKRSHTAGVYSPKFRVGQNLEKVLLLLRSPWLDAFFNVLKEFWPDMRHKMFGK